MTEVVDTVVDRSTSVDNLKSGVAERFKKVRRALGLTQNELATLMKKPLPSVRDYERGKSIPGGDAIASLVRAGIDSNWLLTGEGDMRIARPGTHSHGHSPTESKVEQRTASYNIGINVDAMVQAFCVTLQTAPKGETVEQSARKAVAFYEYCREKGLITPEGEGEGDLKKAV